jgi:LemA protein
MLFVVVAVLLTVVLIGRWTVRTYNMLVQRRNRVENAFASVDVAAKKRYDLVPSLVACVRGYMEHERSLLEEIVRLRTRAQSGGLAEDARLEASDQMSAMLSRMMMLSEGYPELKADTQFLHLQRTLTELEEQLSAARRFFNTAVTQYNDLVQSVPTNLIAPRLGFVAQTWFRVAVAERAAPQLDLAPASPAAGGTASEQG